MRHPILGHLLAALAAMLVCATALAQPYAVGYRDLDLFNVAVGRTTAVRLYYPAAIPGDGVPFAADSGVSYPSIAFAGQTGIAIGAYRYIVDHLVSHGYVVAILRPSGSTQPEAIGLELGGIPRSLRAAVSDARSPLFGAPIGSRSALGGHALGGAAAVFGTSRADSIEMPHFTLGPLVTADPRVLVAARSVHGPALTISGTRDCIAPDSTNALRLHDALASSCRTRVAIVGGGHCYFAAQEITCQIAEAECTVAPAIAREEQQRIVDSLLLPWLDWQLKDRCDGLGRFAAFVDSSRAIVASRACDDPAIGASLLPGDSGLFCPRDSIILTAPAGATSYLWSTGDVTRSITVKSSGSFSVAARGGECTVRSRAVRIDSALSFPMLPRRAAICPGTPAHLATGVVARHRWSTGDTTAEIDVTLPGRYWVTVSNEHCAVTSDTVEVIAAFRPRVGVGGSLDGCAGDEVRLRAPSYLQYVFWSDGRSSSEIAVTTGGSWWFSAVDTTGCVVISDTVTIVRHAPVTPTIAAAGRTLTSSPAITYQWLLDDSAIAGATSRTHIAVVDGAYAVSTVDSNGCTATSARVAVQVGRVEGLDGTEAIVVGVRASMLYVEVRSTGMRGASRATITLVDVRGAVVRYFEDSYAAIPLDELPSGIYHLIVERDHSRIAARPIVVTH
jgi:hypothetical protein